MTSPVSAIEAIEKAMEGVRADRIERLWWFLHILDKSCGTTNANDDQWNWINAFCTDFEDDTFNRAAKLGLIRVTHNDLSEDSTARLTDAGKAFAAYFKDSPSSAAARKAEALQREMAEKDERIAALESALKPFARSVDVADRRADALGFARSFDQYVVEWSFPFDTLRRARALLGGENDDH